MRSEAVTTTDVVGLRYGAALELKEDGWGIEGLASTYDLDEVGDEVVPGAYAETLARNPRPPLLWSHKPDSVIGVARELKETPAGLFGRWKISRTAQGADVRQLLLDKAVDGLSIGFLVGRGDVEPARDGVRRLKRITLMEISVVAMPANLGARIQRVKAAARRPSLVDDYLRHLRLSGMTTAQRRGYALLLRHQLMTLTMEGGR